MILGPGRKNIAYHLLCLLANMNILLLLILFVFYNLLLCIKAESKLLNATSTIIIFAQKCEHNCMLCDIKKTYENKTEWIKPYYMDYHPTKVIEILFD